LYVAAKTYLLEVAAKRSKNRYVNLRYNFQRFILPYFGSETLISRIRPEDIEDFIEEHRQRVKPMTLWHYVKDLKALLNWGVSKHWLLENPASKADLSPLRYRQSVKMPLDPKDVEKAANVLTGLDRTYFDFLRFTGLRREEANRVRWQDLDLERALLRVPGTKTPHAEAVIPLAPALTKQLQGVERTSEYVFPTSVGTKAYDRRRIFKKIEIACGVKLTAKDLRDYFAGEIAARTEDPNVLMKLMRHTNLRTTTTYLRTVERRMKDAVETLGKVNG
jgi:integrase